MLIRLGFAEMGVERVLASTFEGNAGSRRVMAKLGMRLARALRFEPVDLSGGGSQHLAPEDLFDGDYVQYALDRADWERRG